jgi:hypothetical protein
MAVTRKNRTRKNESVQMGGKMITTGTKAQVYHGTAKHTAGGLTKKDLMKTKRGRIVSKKQHASGLKAIKKLRKMGFIAKKGKFTLFRKTMKKRGGSPSAGFQDVQAKL